MPVALFLSIKSECLLTGGVAGIFLVGEFPGERPRPQPFSLAFDFFLRCFQVTVPTGCLSDHESGNVAFLSGNTDSLRLLKAVPLRLLLRRCFAFPPL